MSPSPPTDAPVQILDNIDYAKADEEIKLEIEKMKSSSTRFQRIKDRTAKSQQIIDSATQMQTGKYKTNWRGVNMMKDCREMIVYQQILGDLKPRTIIELGTYLGGSALWAADTMRSYKLPFHLYTLDVNQDIIHKKVKEDLDITCILGDAGKIEESFPVEMMKSLPHPWLVIEDCHVNLMGTMEHFAEYMLEGDYYAVEDTGVNMVDWGDLMDLDTMPYSGTEDGEKWATLKKFLVKYEDDFMVDSFFTDYFAFNGTNTWDGYLRKMK